MSVSHIRAFLVALGLALLTGSALAQTASPLALPPSADQDQAPVIISAPDAGSNGLALPPSTTPPSSMPVPLITAPPVVAPAPVVAAPAVVVAPPVAAPQPVVAVQPVVTAPPVVTTPLNDIKADSIGTLSGSEGGLGAGLWQGTSRVLVERFLPMLVLPSPFASLNNLAGRFLLTTAAAPEGTSNGGQSLTALRMEKLVALGKNAEAWRLAGVAGTDKIDDLDLRQAAEAALVSPAASDVCAKLPAIIQKHSDSDWLKLMVVCQLQAKDAKGAQVTLDLLHTQDAHSEIFFALAEKNIIAGNKQLPRQLTPLTPIHLALLRLANLPVRTEVFVHPAAALVPELLKARPEDENARLSLAERSAAKGIISTAELADIYRNEAFAPGAATANIGGEQGPTLRALLYQASQQEKNPQNRAREAIKFLQSLDASLMSGSVLTLLGDMIGDVQPTPELNADAATIARVYILSGKSNNALAWLDQARGAPQAAVDMQNLWPVAALAGLESGKDFAKDLNAWLDATLAPARPDADVRAQKATAASVLLLLDAVGFPVGDEAWAKVADNAAYEKVALPPAVVLERLRIAASANHKGEAILMGLLALGGGKDDPPVLVTAAAVRALRAVGLKDDAGNLAKEAAVRIMNAPTKP